jgi:hypothetical protein
VSLIDLKAKKCLIVQKIDGKANNGIFLEKHDRRLIVTSNTIIKNEITQ